MFETFLTVFATLVFVFSTLVLLSAAGQHPSKLDGNRVLKVLCVWGLSGAWLIAAVIS